MGKTGFHREARDDNIENNQDTYSLEDDGTSISLVRLAKWKMLWEKTEICKLPSEDCLYFPISIMELDQYAIIVIDNFEDEEQTISLFLPPEGDWTNNKWEMAEFIFPDGRVQQTFVGQARRSFVPLHLESSPEEIGRLELCEIVEAKGAVEYSVTYLDDAVHLTEKTIYSDGIPDTWTF